MLPTNDRKRQYVVSLDSLDLALLRQHVEKSNESQRLLWSVPKAEGESTLYEVKLEIEDGDYESSYIESSKTILCHVCNINVPQTYFKQHTKSEIHKKYMRLIEKILENVSKQINIDLEDIRDDDQREKFYCETCCKVVLVAHRRKHIISKYHLKCTEKQKQLDKFLKVYTKSHEIASDTDPIDSMKNSNRIQNDKDSPEVEFSTDSEFSESDSDHSRSVTHPNNKITSYKSSNTIENNEKNKNTIMHSLEIDLDDTIYIVTPKGYKEKVKMKNIHSYVECSSFLFCQLCNKWLLNDIHEHIEHSKNEEHLINITQPIKDDFTRIVINKNKSHCVICNIIVRTDTDHTDVHTNHDKNVSNVYENWTDVIIETSDYDLDTHNSHDTKSNTPDKTTVHLHTVTSSPNKIQDRQYLNDSKRHIQFDDIQIDETQKIPEENRVQSTNEACFEHHVLKTASNVQLDNVNEIDALNALATSSHENESAETAKHLRNIYNDYIKEFSATEMMCEICHLKIPNTDILEHVKGSIHTHKLKIKLRQNKIIKVTDQIYNCQLCNTNISDFIEHINENVSHIKNRVMSKSVSKVKLRAYIYENLSSNTALAKAYQDIYEEILKENKIIKQNESGKFYCSVCKMKMTRISEIDHVFGQRHNSFFSRDNN